MLFQTPKDKTIIWIIALLLFFLIPITFYLTEKVMLEISDVQIAGASATRVLIGWFIVLLLMSPFIIIFIRWTLKDYKAETPFFIFNFKRVWWSSFWTFFFVFWIYFEINAFLRFFKQFYFPEAFQLITVLLLFYLQLCLWVCIILKERKLSSDIMMICLALILTVFIQNIIFF